MNWTDKITITNEDAMELMSRYPNKHFNLGIIDPPYGIGEDGSKNHTRGKLAKSFDYVGYVGGDMMPPDKEYFKELFRVCENVIIWGANHFIENLPTQNSSCWLVWDKLNGETDFADCELAWASFKTTVRAFRFRWQGMLQGDMKNKESRIHPNQKPVALYDWVLKTYAKKTDKILDTHHGSGSLAISSHKYGCELVACDKDKHYYDQSFDRFKEFYNGYGSIDKTNFFKFDK
jgi:site-specific DNA-methyltransferase (adenine-specific)